MDEPFVARRQPGVELGSLATLDQGTVKLVQHDGVGVVSGGVKLVYRVFADDVVVGLFLAPGVRWAAKIRIDRWLISLRAKSPRAAAGAQEHTAL